MKFTLNKNTIVKFENENFTLETLFKSINGYDSLAVMSIIAFVDENFKMMNVIENGQIIKIFPSGPTVRDLDK